ncbi:MAG: hypothetical protein JNN15_12400, partial [Blastocatellia bacterium]|nr:hypothetical protein [Blastocatellia bacterium]
ILKLSKFSCEPLYSPSAKRNYLLQVVGSVLEGKLNFSFTYSRNIHRRDTIESLAKSFSDNLTELINNSQQANTKLSPIDFPEAELSQADLDKILAAE